MRTGWRYPFLTLIGTFVTFLLFTKTSLSKDVSALGQKQFVGTSRNSQTISAFDRGGSVQKDMWSGVDIRPDLVILIGNGGCRSDDSARLIKTRQFGYKPKTPPKSRFHQEENLFIPYDPLESLVQISSLPSQCLPPRLKSSSRRYLNPHLLDHRRNTMNFWPTPRLVQLRSTILVM